MRPPIECITHGKQRRALVCAHVLELTQSGKHRGFVWQRDAEGEYEAICTACSQLPLEKWRQEEPHLVRPICLQCFAELGRRNGIVWPNDAQKK